MFAKTIKNIKVLNKFVLNIKNQKIIGFTDKPISKNMLTSPKILNYYNLRYYTFIFNKIYDTNMFKCYGYNNYLSFHNLIFFNRCFDNKLLVIVLLHDLIFFVNILSLLIIRLVKLFNCNR